MLRWALALLLSAPVWLSACHEEDRPIQPQGVLPPASGFAGPTTAGDGVATDGRGATDGRAANDGRAAADTRTAADGRTIIDVRSSNRGCTSLCDCDQGQDCSPSFTCVVVSPPIYCCDNAGCRTGQPCVDRFGQSSFCL